LQEDPAGSLVNGDDEVIASFFVRNFGGILDIDVDVAWLVLLEPLDVFRPLFPGVILAGGQSARHGGVNSWTTTNRASRAARGWCELDSDMLFQGAERGMNGFWGGGAILDRVAVFPFVDRCSVEVVLPVLGVGWHEKLLPAHGGLEDDT